MSFLEVIQWALGFAISYYLYKALLGRMRDGDGLKLSAVALIWFSIILVTSGLIKIN